jgi:hypothetical protein
MPALRPIPGHSRLSGPSDEAETGRKASSASGPKEKITARKLLALLTPFYHREIFSTSPFCTF